MSLNEKFINCGVTVKMDIKKAFMKECLQYDVVTGKIVDILGKRSVRERISVSDISLGKGKLMRIEMTEDDLEYIFDKITKKKKGFKLIIFSLP